MRQARRHFLAGMIASSLIPRPSWADAGSPAYLSAAADKNGNYLLCGIGADLSIIFTLPLPARGHAATAHPARPEAVAFARRPGTFAVILDCASGTQKAMLTAPKGRHFYGHGAFSADGRWLFTTENDFENGTGRIGVWDASAGYRRQDEFASGGIGPHDIKRLPESDTLVIANGGIDTHPESGRAKLNIPTMRPNLSYVENGAVVEQAELPSHLHKNSIRHLAVAPDGTVAFGMQWQGEALPSALVGLHKRGQTPRLLPASADEIRAMQAYIGSVALSPNGQNLLVTSPRGGLAQVFDLKRNTAPKTLTMTDICGTAPGPSGFVVTSGTGQICATKGADLGKAQQHALAFDNHLIPISAG
ncbi:MAG: DUF1513 domain-containing protein [Sulfitobacter sp.]